MPILTAGYFLDTFDYNTVLYSVMSYFISDFPEILYNKDYTYMIHHIISLLILKSAKHLPKEVHSKAVINLFLLEIGSSVLSLPIIFKKKFLYTLRPYVFFISRIITIINTAYLIKNPKLHFYTKMVMSFLSILLIADNSKTLIKLCKKNVQHTEARLCHTEGGLRHTEGGLRHTEGGLRHSDARFHHKP